MTLLKIRIDKKDTFIYIGAASCLIGIYYGHTLLLGIFALICGFIAKYHKAKFWSWVIIGAIGTIILHFLKIFY